MSPSHELVIFDLDGTLIEFHTEYLISQTFSILDRIGHPPVTRDTLLESFSSFDYFRFFLETERDRLTEQFWTHFDWEGFPHPQPITGVHDALKELQNHGLEIAIVTSRFVPESELRKKLAHTGLVDYMSIIKTRPGDHIHWTDKRASIEDVCQRLGIAPKNTVMVGDIPADITSALDVGVGTAVAVLSGGIKHEVLAAANPHHIIEDVSHLAKTLQIARR